MFTYKTCITFAGRAWAINSTTSVANCLPRRPLTSQATTAESSPAGTKQLPAEAGRFEEFREIRTEVLNSRRSDLKLVAAIAGLSSVLVADVFLNHLVGHGAAGRHKVPASPHVAAPILLLQMSKFHQQLPRTLAFDVLHDFAGRKTRRARQQHMDMVSRNGPLQDFDFVRATNLANQLPQPNANFPHENRLSILGHPDKVVLDVKTAVRTGTISFHSPILPGNGRT